MGGNPVNLSDPLGLDPITFGHGARHLAGTDLCPSDVEQTIAGHIAPIMPFSTPGAPYSGIVNVNGVNLQYRAYPLSNGITHVGTYFPW